MSKITNFILILFVVSFVGCSAAQKVGDTAGAAASGAANAAGDAADATKKMASGDDAMTAAHGTWDWSVDSPDGTFTGTVTVEGPADALTGYMTSDEGGDQKLPLSEVKLEGDILMFSFDNPDYGSMMVKGTIDGDKIDSMLNVVNMGVDLPMKMTRKKDM